MRGLAALGKQLSVSAPLPTAREHVTYLAAHAAVLMGFVGFVGVVGKIDASHYRGNPVDNPGPTKHVERTVINDKISGSLVYPLLLSSSRT
ncbi:hypothetical protein [Paraburkholderia sp. SG-MS1]|uniref:hypothetical protein n=1 Tax=Paraburkholderia sp. SG-MS1 TaxID=2023741 RepID=UPI001EEA80DF|nr:hypothetical protein [Paraburkholderia sp. SG-MS1]